MTRLEKIIKAFNQYDTMVDNIIWTKEQENKLNDLRNEVSLLVGELKRHGCRKQDKPDY